MENRNAQVNNDDSTSDDDDDAQFHNQPEHQMNRNVQQNQESDTSSSASDVGEERNQDQNSTSGSEESSNANTLSDETGGSDQENVEEINIDERNLEREQESSDSENDRRDDFQEEPQEDNIDSESETDNDAGDEVEGVGEEEDEVDDVGEGEDEGQDEGEDFGWEYADNGPVYDLAPVTVGESMLAVLSLFLRHNLTLACLDDLLRLINLHCRAERNCFPKSVHQFKKYFKNTQFPVVRHFYCETCFRIVPEKNAACENCNEGRGTEFFIEVPVVSQIKALYKRAEFREKLNYRFERVKKVNENYEDIYDGAVYRELCRNGGVLSNPNNISLMWYTDGVSIFKSSKYELWPFYFVINELPLFERCKLTNALLAGLWFGKSQPQPSTFLQPIRDDILRLRNGIRVQCGDRIQNVKGVVICGTADAPAKAKFLNIKNHNANYGCAKCRIRTRNIRRGLNVYPFLINLVMRTDEETLQHAREAMLMPLHNGQRQDVFGVKGPSLLSAFVYQAVRTTAVDVMHCVYLGIMKSLMLFWFDPKFRDENFSLRARQRLVNMRLSKMTPPSIVQRLTRTLDDIKYWKAHELKSFLLNYSLAILSDLLPELYLDHHKLLVLGIYLLSQRSISDNMITQAAEVLTEYVSQFENLYGLEHMVSNVHQLLHLPKIVRDLGPLFTTNCAPFEDINGKLKKLVKGTRHAELQVCSGIPMLLKFSELKQNIPEGIVSDFVNKICDKNRWLKIKEIGEAMAIVGKYSHINPLPQIVHDALNRSQIEGRNFYEFYRFMKYGAVYGSQRYGRAVSTNSTCIKYTFGINEEIGFVDHFLRVTNCDCVNLCDNCNAQYVAIVRKCETQTDFQAWEGADLSFIHTLVAEGELRAVDVSNIIAMCYVVKIDDRNITYLVEPPNMIEAE